MELGLIIAGIVISVISTITSTVMQAAAQDQQVRMMQKTNADAAERARAAAVLEHNANELAAQGKEDSAAQRYRGTQLEGLDARATAYVTGGEAGVGGKSFRAGVRNLYRQEANNLSAVERNLQFDRVGGDISNIATNLRYKNRIETLPNVPNSGLQMAGTVMSGVGNLGSLTISGTRDYYNAK